MPNQIYDPLALYIDGEWISGGGRDCTNVVNPATGEVLGALPTATAADLDRALESSHRAFLAWRRVSALERADILRKAAALIRARLDHIAGLMTLEQGKVLAEARIEVEGAAESLEWFADEGRRAYGRIIPPRVEGARHLVTREPVGPVAAFSPWNFPAVAPTRKIAGALAAGCSCIIKPAEETPGTALAIARALADAGLPAGVLNMVFGHPPSISEHLIASPTIKKVTFTGSTTVGRHIARLSAAGLKKVSLELGGHAPVIVFDDADPGAAVTAALGKIRNAGQVCVSPTRFIVQQDRYKAFVSEFSERLAAVTVGDGFDSHTQMGPVANERRFLAMDEFVADAANRGGKVATGGSPAGNVGYRYRPTVLTDLDPDSRILNEEPFGPIATVMPFRGMEDALFEANRLPYGLAAYLFTGSLRTATAMGDGLECGLVGVNSFAIGLAETPFGGVKDSGYGSEAGMEGLDAFLTTKFIAQHS